MKTLFLTGASGFLGKYLVRDLQAQGFHILALIRPGSLAKVTSDPAYAGVTWIRGSLERLSETLTADDRLKLENVTDLVHAAAVYDLAQSEAQMYGSNVTGTHEVIRLANTLPKLTTLHHVSTLAVAGDSEEPFSEENFDERQCLPDGYSATKFASEGCVRYSDTPYAKKIYRLGILVGDSKTGWIPKIDGLYYVLKFLLQNETMVRGLVGKAHLLPFPFGERSKTYLVPVDVASKAIVGGVVQKSTKTRFKKNGISTYHVVGDGQTIREVLTAMVEFLGVHARLVPLPKLGLNDLVVEKLGVPKEALHYLYEAPVLTSDRFKQDFPDFEFPKFETYANTLFRYARQQCL